MAVADEAVEEILTSLGASRLGWAATEARAAVDALPQHWRETPEARMLAGREQVDALRQTVLYPLKRELEALEALPGLAKELGLSPHVNILVQEGERPPRRMELTSAGRRKRLIAFIAALGQALGEADERIGTREGPNFQ